MQEVAGTARGHLGWVDNGINITVHMRVSVHVGMMLSGTANMKREGRADDHRRSATTISRAVGAMTSASSLLMYCTHHIIIIGAGTLHCCSCCSRGNFG